jgi:hypothetical protein
VSSMRRRTKGEWFGAERIDIRQDGPVMRDLVLRLGVAIIVFGLFGLALTSGLPDAMLIVGGFAVAAIAIWLGLRLRGDEPEDPGT